MSKEINKRYPVDTVNVVWKPGKCIHSAECAKNLSAVFKPKEKPWIDVDGASEGEIIDQVNACPSGALSIENKE
ncbi:MAG: putative Fe-S cluster protein YjdI [Sphingobacteriales bacterium]|jgi:uncharacterized Fe-S cluster protein YjdI